MVSEKQIEREFEIFEIETKNKRILTCEIDRKDLAKTKNFESTEPVSTKIDPSSPSQHHFNSRLNFLQQKEVNELTGSNTTLHKEKTIDNSNSDLTEEGPNLTVELDQIV